MAAAVRNKMTEKRGVMQNFMGFNFKSKKVICSSNISKSDMDGVIRLYEALVPRKEVVEMRMRVIKKHFPNFEDIDVDMIINEAFPRFEKTIGEENFAKIKKFFGIGCKANKRQYSKEIDSLLAEMRTIENAQYYICGYKELIRKLGNLLECPEEYSDIERAKIVRMYSILFLCYIYFVEDLGYETIINYYLLNRNNKLVFYPEELFDLFTARYTEVPEKNIFCDAIIFELNQIKDKKIFKEILEFSELEYNGERFVSVNKANPYQTFAKVRTLKQKIHSEPVISPIELFGVIKFAKQVDFADLYGMYKNLTSYDLDEFPKSEREFERFEGSRIVSDKYFCYEVKTEQYISGEREKARIINLFKIFAQKNLTMRLESDMHTGKQLSDKKEYNVRDFLAAIKFAKDANLASKTTLVRDFEIADELIKRDKKKNVLSRYYQEEISILEVKSELKIDETFEFEFFGIKPKIDHKEVFVNFAIQNEYAESRESISTELIENVLIPGNEGIIEQFQSGEIGIDKFEKKLGFDSNFAKMFFDFSKIDIGSIETELLEAKKSSVGKKKLNHNLKMIVLLYCYVIEGQIPCGPKNRVPKRNKALKTSILKTLV